MVKDLLLSQIPPTPFEELTRNIFELTKEISYPDTCEMTALTRNLAGAATRNVPAYRAITATTTSRRWFQGCKALGVGKESELRRLLFVFFVFLFSFGRGDRGLFLNEFLFPSRRPPPPAEFAQRNSGCVLTMPHMQITRTEPKKSSTTSRINCRSRRMGKGIGQRSWRAIVKVL